MFLNIHFCFLQMFFVYAPATGVPQTCTEPESLSTSLAFMKLLTSHSTVPFIPPYLNSLSQTDQGDSVEVGLTFDTLVEIVQTSIMSHMMESSGCDWRYEIDVDENRIPSKIVHAVRKRKHCYKGTCRPLKTHVQTLKKNCNSDTGIFAYDEITENVLIGFQCVSSIQARRGRPHYRPSLKPEMK